MYYIRLHFIYLQRWTFWYEKIENNNTFEGNIFSIKWIKLSSVHLCHRTANGHSCKKRNDGKIIIVEKKLLFKHCTHCLSNFYVHIVRIITEISKSVKHKSHPIDLHITYFKVKDILETCRLRIVVAPEWIDWIFRSRN